MNLKIEFTDGTKKEWSYVDQVTPHDGVLTVLPERHGYRTLRFPLANIKVWETDR